LALNPFADQVKGVLCLGSDERFDVETGNRPVRVRDNRHNFSPRRDVTESLNDESSLVAYLPRV
jgi:hypothetical protein